MADRRFARRLASLDAAAVAVVRRFSRLPDPLRRPWRWIRRERRAAKILQHSRPAAALPDLPGVRLAARTLTGQGGTKPGGDWYDVIPLRTGEVALVMGDVAGHDDRAASAMTQLRVALRAYICDGGAPGDVLERLNTFCTQVTPEEMATCLYAVLDPVTGTLDLASAGHYPPLVIDAAGAVRSLDASACPPIGAVRGARFPTTRYQLAPGSTVALFTDGLVERRGHSVSEGLATLEEVLSDPVADVDVLCDRVLRALIVPTAPADDVALLVVRPFAPLGNHVLLRWPAEPSCLVTMRRALERWLIEVGSQDQERYEVVVACSEAATNAIEHAYGPGSAEFEICGDFDPGSRRLRLVVRDHGHWRDARGRDRGRGLQLIAGLMTELQVVCSDSGTQVHMSRYLGTGPPDADAASLRIVDGVERRTGPRGRPDAPRGMDPYDWHHQVSLTSA